MKKEKKRSGPTPAQKKDIMNRYKGNQIAEIQEGDLKQVRPGFSKGGSKIKKSKGRAVMKKSKGRSVMKMSKGGSIIAGNANRRRQNIT